MRIVVAAGFLAAVADFSSPYALGVSLPTVVHPPKTLFTRTMFATATITTVGKQIDKCRGPVSVPLLSRFSTLRMG